MYFYNSADMNFITSLIFIFKANVLVYIYNWVFQFWIIIKAKKDTKALFMP